MVIFLAVTFCIIPIVVSVIVFNRINISDTLLELILWPLRLIFIASPLVALLLGLRGLLPGTKASNVTQPGANITSWVLTPIVIVIVGLFTLGAWVAFLPPPGRPDMSIAFLGYTNNAAGTRLATIKVTNLNPTTIFVYAPLLEIQAPTDPGGYKCVSGVHCSWSATLDRGASGSFTIPPPTNRSPWRLSFYVYPDRGRSVKNTLKHIVSISCLSVGLWPTFARLLPIDGAFRMPYFVEGGWIKNEQ